MDWLRHGVVRVSGNLWVYKQMLPVGKDILNNNKAPIKFIIKLMSEEVDTLWICGVLLGSKRACRENEWVCVRKILLGYVDCSRRSLQCRYTNRHSSQRHRNIIIIIVMTSSGNIANVSLQPTHNTNSFHKKMVVESNFKNWNVNQSQTKCLKLYSAVQYSLCIVLHLPS